MPSAMSAGVPGSISSLGVSRYLWCICLGRPGWRTEQEGPTVYLFHPDCQTTLHGRRGGVKGNQGWVFHFWVLLFFPLGTLLHTGLEGWITIWRGRILVCLGTRAGQVWRGKPFSKDLSLMALTGQELLQWSLVKQLSEVIIACIYFFIQGAFEHIYFIWNELRVVLFGGRMWKYPGREKITDWKLRYWDISLTWGVSGAGLLEWLPMTTWLGVALLWGRRRKSKGTGSTPAALRMRFEISHFEISWAWTYFPSPVLC